MTNKRSPAVTGAISVAGVLLSWLPFFVFAPLGFFLWLPFAIWTFARGGWRPFLLSAVLTPAVLVPSYSVASAVRDYAEGSAVIRGIGYPGAEYANLDPELRIYARSSGCIVTGAEPLTHIPYNLAVIALIRTLGPMPGAWTGAYPTRAEAWALASAGSTVHQGVRVEVVPTSWAPQGSELHLIIAQTGERIAVYTHP